MLMRGVDLFVESGGKLLPTILLKPRITAIPDNRQQPGSRVAAAKAFKRPQRPQASLLHQILRIVIVSDEPAREIVRAIKVRQHRLLEERQLLRLGQAPSLSRHIEDSSYVGFIPAAETTWEPGIFLLDAQSMQVKQARSAMVAVRTGGKNQCEDRKKSSFF